MGGHILLIDMTAERGVGILALVAEGGRSYAKGMRKGREEGWERRTSEDA